MVPNDYFHITIELSNDFVTFIIAGTLLDAIMIIVKCKTHSNLC